MMLTLTLGGVRLLWRILVCLALAGIVVVLAVAVVIPRLGGATPYTILTGSMEPERPPGTLVVIRPVDPDEVKVGDIVTYQLESGEPTVVTHRVVSVGVSMRHPGERTFRTQGDANDVPDAKPVREVQLRGRLWYSVPHLGRISNTLDNDQRTTATLVVAGALALYAVGMFASALRDRVRRRSTSTPVATPAPTTTPTAQEETA